MARAIFTSYQGSYQLGVAALLNSVVRSGFSGEFHIFHQGEGLPPWTQALSQGRPGSFDLGEIQLSFHRASPSRHFGYDKPFQALQLLDARPEIDSLCYFDPDVVVLSPWSFFDHWITCGVGVVMDCNAPLVPADHPWRCAWRALALRAGSTTPSPNASSWYANSGFFCLHRRHRGVLDLWRAITEQFEAEGGDTQSFHLDERWRSVTGDQDLLAATLEKWDGPVSVIGPDGMGFNRHYWLLSHAVEKPKPWLRKSTLDALKGTPPSRTVGFYLEYCNGAVQSCGKTVTLLKRADYRIGRLIGCLWRRP